MAVALSIVNAAVVARHNRGHVWVLDTHVGSKPDILVMDAIITSCIISSSVGSRMGRDSIRQEFRNAAIEAGVRDLITN